DRDLLADELLGDRLGGLLHELLREAVLDRGGLALDGSRADRERKLELLDDPVEEQVPLRGLELLGVLLGLGQRAKLIAVLLADRLDRGLEAKPLEQHVETRAH